MSVQSISPPIRIFETAPDIRSEISEQRLKGLRIGFVPTMGYLHEGHLSLVDHALQCADRVYASIFVNPAQFNDPGDLDRYPRDVERDLELFRERGVRGVFFPSVQEVYRPGFDSSVEVSKLSLPLEGEMRPGHFRGVATVVAVLFNIVQPDLAVFGEKDFQQLRIIEQMVHDLHMSVEIVRAELVRETDGLALSSRNILLSVDERERALAISRGLFAARAAFDSGESDARALQAVVQESLTEAGDMDIEYVAVARESDLSPFESAGAEDGRILVAVKIGRIRLIDNIALPARNPVGLKVAS